MSEIKYLCKHIVFDKLIVGNVCLCVFECKFKTFFIAFHYSVYRAYGFPCGVVNKDNKTEGDCILYVSSIGVYQVVRLRPDVNKICFINFLCVNEK